MAIKDILVLLSDDKSNAGRVKTAIHLADLHNANLTGLALGSMKPVHAPEDNDKATARMSERMAEALLDNFAAEIKETKIPSSTIMVFGGATSSGQKVAHYARNFDLVILSQPNPARDNYLPMIEFSKQVLLHSGRPVLFIPYTGINQIPLRRAMIAWDGTPAVSRSVHDAIPLLRIFEEVLILVVESDKQQHSKKEVLVNGLSKHLVHHNIMARVLKVNPGANSVSSVILNQVTENNIELLVMGGHGTPSLKQKIFGNVTSKLLASMVVPVFMSD